MSIYETDAVASFIDKAADVGNKDAALRTQNVLQAQKDRIDGQLAAEIVAMKAAGEVSSEKYRLLLSETTALSTAISAAKAEASVAALKEERLDLAKMAPQGGESLIADADAKLYAQIREGLVTAREGYKTQLNVELPLPVIAQDKASGKNKVAPVKAVAPKGKTQAEIEASYRAYESALRNDFSAASAAVTDFVIPTLVVDLIGYIVTYPRLFNKFKVYQTMGVEDLLVNRIEDIAEAKVIGTATNRGQSQTPTPDNDVMTSNVKLRALKVAAFTKLTPELVNTLPADALQTRISDYLAQSLGLKYARDAVTGDNSETRGNGVAAYINGTVAAGAARRVNGKNTTDVAANIDRGELTKLFAHLGGEYQSLVGGLTLATNTTTFWQLWSNIQQDYPLLSDSRNFVGHRLGPWEVCIDDRIDDVGDDNMPILAGDFMRAWGIRYAGALRLEVSYEDAFRTDEITVRAIQHFDTQPLELKAVAGYRSIKQL